MLAAMICAAFGLARAGQPAGAPGRLDAVTVYRSQAAVTRVVAAPDGAGPMEIVVTDLPDRVVPESLHADGGEGVQIRAVRYRERPLSEEPRKDVREIDGQIESLEKLLRENQQTQELARKKQSFLDNLGAFSAQTARDEVKKGLLKTDELSKLTLFVFKQQGALAKELLTLRELERQLSGEVSLLRRKRSSLTRGESRSAREVVIFLEKQKPGQAAIRLGYLVKGVEWKPSYNIRSTNGRAEVELEYNASIQQMSGEDWKGVKLLLSTATPTLSADPPALAPFRVTLETAPESKSGHEIVKVERERMAAEERFRAAQTDETRQQAEAAANTAAAQLNVLYFRGGPKFEDIVPLDSRERGTAALAVSYPLPGRHSLASRSDLQTIQITSLKLKAEFYRLAEPTLTRYVYRQAQVTNKSGTVLLQGKVNAYLDGRFAGTGTLPLVRPGQRFIAGFGVDSRLNTKQKLLERKENIIAGNRELTLTYQILLENFSDQSLSLRVLDRLPVPAEGRIYVSLLDCKPPPSKDPAYERRQKPRNILRWDVEVPAGATEEKALTIQYQFKVGFDKSLQVNAGRTITPLFALARPLEPWKVEHDWSKDQTKLALESGQIGQPQRITVSLVRGKEGKNVIGRRIEGDLSGFRWLIVDLENQIRAGTRMALGLSTGKDWNYFESTPNYVRPGENPNVVFDLTAPNYKTEGTNWQYRTRPQSVNDVRALYLVFYPSSNGTVVVRDIKLAK